MGVQVSEAAADAITTRRAGATTGRASGMCYGGAPAMPMPRLDLTLLGGFTARLPSGKPIALPTRKAQALLAYLALPPGQPHQRDTLAALLWGDMAVPQARGSVRKAVSWLKRALEGSGALLVEGHDVALDPDRVVIDVRTFEDRVKTGSPEALDVAADLYTGDLLAGLALREPPFDDWLGAERARLRELALDGLGRLLEHRRAAGALDAAVRAAQKLAALDPLQESAHRALIRLYTDTGQRAAALRQYQLCVSALARELGTEPEAETRALYQDVLRGRGAGPRAPSQATFGALALAPLSLQPATPHAPEAPLVGRHAEMVALAEALDAAFEGHGRMVALEGEAGIGKSRLGAEVQERAGQRGAHALVGRCYETERTLPLAPWLDAIRAADPARDEPLLASLGPAWRNELSRLLPELGTGAGPSGTGEAINLFEAIVQLLDRLATRRPLVLVLEDVHWADETSLRLLHFLGRRIAHAPVLVLATVRDDAASTTLLRQVLDELAGEGVLARVPLAPLSRAETATLVERMLPSAAAHPERGAIEAQTWRTSEGNPFIATETARMLARSGTVADPGDLPLPERVRRLIVGRLDRLTERGRRLAGAAAVIGRQCEFALLHRAAELSEDAGAEGIEELVRARILHQDGEGLAFTHDRVREVCYGELLRPRRTLLHRRVAETLEAMGSRSAGAHALAIGTHYREAEVWDKAVAFLQQAGFQAASRTSTRDAVVCYQDALAALGHLPEGTDALERGSDLRFSLAHACYVLGDFARAGENFRAAEAESARLGDDRRRGYVLGGLSYMLDTTGRHAEALDASEAALAIGGALQDRPLEVWASLSLARSCFALGRYPRAIEQMQWVRQAIAGNPPGERFGRGASLLPSVATPAWLALCLARTGEFVDAVALGEEAVRLADAVGGPAESVAACYALGRAHLERGSFEHAIAVYEVALPLCQAGRFPIYTPRFLAAVAAAYAHVGRLDESLALFDQAVTLARDKQLAYGQALILLQHGEALRLAGQRLEAERVAREALDLSRQRGERGDEAWALYTLASVAIQDAAGLETAAAFHLEAIDHAQALGMRLLQARAELDLAAVQRGLGREEDAQRLLDRATRELARMQAMVG